MFRNAAIILALLATLSFGTCDVVPEPRNSQEPIATSHASDRPTNVTPSRSPTPKTREGLGWMYIREDYYEQDEWRWQFPGWAYEQIEGTETEKKYDLSNEVNPFLINGDFDGDGKYDVAVTVVNRADKQDLRVVVVHSSGGHFVFGFGGPNWELYPKGKVYQGVEEGPPPKLKGDALFFVKPESASHLYFWSGKEYKYYHQGD